MSFLTDLIKEKASEVLADKIKDEMIPAMDELRANCDKLELETAAEYWPFPTYGELLFGVR